MIKQKMQDVKDFISNLTILNILGYGLLFVSYYFSYKLFKDLANRNIAIIMAITIVALEAYTFSQVKQYFRRDWVVFGLCGIFFSIVFVTNITASSMYLKNLSNKLSNESKINSHEYLMSVEKEKLALEAEKLALEKQRNPEILDEKKLEEKINTNIEAIKKKKEINAEKVELNNIYNKLDLKLKKIEIKNAPEYINQQKVIDQKELDLTEIIAQIRSAEEEAIKKRNTIDFETDSENEKSITKYSLSDGESGFESFILEIIIFLGKENPEEKAKIFVTLFSFGIGVIMEIGGILFVLYSKKSEVQIEVKRKTPNVRGLLKNIQKIKKKREEVKKMREYEEGMQEVEVVEIEEIEEVEERYIRRVFVLETYLNERKKSGILEELKAKELCDRLNRQYGYNLKPQALGRELKKLGVKCRIKDGYTLYTI